MPTGRPSDLTLKQDRRFYVYALVDPRDGATFYIGKGTGYRHAGHLAEWRRGRVVNARKSARIGAICAAGAEPSTVVLSDGLTETEAFREERRLIRELDGLTNLSRGQQSSAEVVAEEAKHILARMVDWFDLPVAERTVERHEMYTWLKEQLHSIIVEAEGGAA